MSTESFSPYSPYTQPLFDPYAPIPTPTNDDPVEEKELSCCEVACGCGALACGSVVVLGAIAVLAAGVGFVVGCVAAAIFSGPILATGLYMAAYMGAGFPILFAVKAIGEGLNFQPFTINLMESIALVALLTLFAGIA